MAKQLLPECADVVLDWVKVGQQETSTGGWQAYIIAHAHLVDSNYDVVCASSEYPISINPNVTKKKLMGSPQSVPYTEDDLAIHAALIFNLVGQAMDDLREDYAGIVESGSGG